MPLYRLYLFLMNSMPLINNNVIVVLVIVTYYNESTKKAELLPAAWCNCLMHAVRYLHQQIAC